MRRLRTDVGEVVETFVDERTAKQVADATGEPFDESIIGQRVGVSVVMKPGRGKHAGRTFPSVAYFLPTGNVLNEKTVWRGPDLTPLTPERQAKQDAGQQAKFDAMMREVKEASVRRNVQGTGQKAEVRRGPKNAYL